MRGCTRSHDIQGVQREGGCVGGCTRSQVRDPGIAGWRLNMQDKQANCADHDVTASCQRCESLLRPRSLLRPLADSCMLRSNVIMLVSTITLKQGAQKEEGKKKGASMGCSPWKGARALTDENVGNSQLA